MDSPHPIKFFDVASSGELEVTTEAIQFFQTLTQPVGLVTVVGPPNSNKSFIASALVKRFGSFGTMATDTAGAWLWPETFPVKSSDEAGEHDFNLLVVETQGIAAEDTGAGQQIFLITSLLSSHLVYVTPQSLTPALECLSVLPDLHTRIQIL